MQKIATSVHIFLEIDRTTKKKLEFETDRVSGREIKDNGGVPPDHDLAKRQGERLELVTNDQVIEIKNGDHFVALPPGTIS